MDAETLEIRHDLSSPTQKAEALSILYAAFDRKFRGLVLLSRSREGILRVLRRSVDWRSGIYAVKAGKVVGVAALDFGAGRRFFRFTRRPLADEFGVVGGLARLGWIRFMDLFQPAARGSLRVEAIAVVADARGHGVGSRLLEKALGDARAAGRSSVTLEVVDTNVAARRLYQRLGFVVRHREEYGPLTAHLGFGGTYWMQRNV